MLLSNILIFCFVFNFKKGGPRSDQENRIGGGGGENLKCSAWECRSSETDQGARESGLGVGQPRRGQPTWHTGLAPKREVAGKCSHKEQSLNF